MTTAAYPIQQLSNLYVTNLNISVASNTTLTITAGQARDNTNVMDIVLGNFLLTTQANTTLDAATTGANGLDTGSLANGTWYAVYVIASSQNLAQPATLLSTSATAPILPENYDSFRRIGWVLTDGSAHFLPFYQSGFDRNRFYQWDTSISVLSSGAATSFTAVNLATAMPPQATPVWLNMAYTPASAANSASVRPTGSSVAASSAPIHMRAAAAALERYTTTRILPQLSSGTARIDYVVTSSDTLSIAVAGFEDCL